jgi:hypothetical protein
MMLYRRLVHVRSQFCGGNTGMDCQQAVGTHATLRMLSLAFPLRDLGEKAVCLRHFSPVLWSNGTLTLHLNSPVLW